MFKQLLLPLPFENAKTTFIEGSSNWEAYTWIKHWPDWQVKFVAIHGEAACGKTHLAKIFQQKSNAYWVTAVDIKQTPDILFKKAQAFIVDNYDEIKDEVWLFHFYNLTKEYQADVLYCGRHSPGQSLFTLPDLRSRMRSIHSITIGQPEEELLMSIAEERLKAMGILLPDDFQEIISYTFKRIERSYTALNIFINKINEIMLREQKSFSLPLVRDVLTIL